MSAAYQGETSPSPSRGDRSPMNAIRRFTSRARAPIPLWQLALVCGVATVWGLLHVWVRLQLIAVGYEISRQTHLHHELTELNQRLSLELRTRMDLATIERLARERLHMAPPDPREVRPITLRGEAPGEAAR